MWISRNDIDRQCAAFRSDRNIDVSQRSRELLTLLFHATEDDPLPRWEDDWSSRERKITEFAAKLEGLLESVVVEEEQQNRPVESITTFHLMHWFGQHLDSWCPIDKD